MLACFALFCLVVLFVMATIDQENRISRLELHAGIDEEHVFP